MSPTPTPQDVDAERAVLGAVLVSPKLFLEVKDVLVENDFYREVHRFVFRAMGELHDAERVIDFLTVKNILDRDGHLEEVGVSYLSGLVDGMPRAANIKGYADLVSDFSDRRKLQQVCREGVVEAHQAPSADSAATQLVERMRESVRVRGEAGQSLGGAIASLLKHLDNQTEATTTGLPTLDGMGSGFRPGELTLLAGRPSHGKTALALHMAKAASEAGLPTYFASLEMT